MPILCGTDKEINIPSGKYDTKSIEKLQYNEVAASTNT